MRSKKEGRDCHEQCTNHHSETISTATDKGYQTVQIHLSAGLFVPDLLHHFLLPAHGRYRHCLQGFPCSPRYLWKQVGRSMVQVLRPVLQRLLLLAPASQYAFDQSAGSDFRLPGADHPGPFAQRTAQSEIQARGADRFVSAALHLPGGCVRHHPGLLLLQRCGESGDSDAGRTEDPVHAGCILVPAHLRWLRYLAGNRLWLHHLSVSPGRRGCLPV